MPEAASNAVVVRPQPDGPGGYVTYEPVSVEMPQAGFIRVAPAFTGVCGSDLDQLAGKVDPNFPITYPYVLGHEWSGVVEAVGPDVFLRPGDHVAGFAYRPGWKNAGAMSDLFLARADMCFALPKDLALDRAALIEPLACAVQGIRAIGGTDAGDQVLVFGCGALGLATIGLVALSGSRIIAVDRSARRLELARILGASAIINTAECLSEDDVDRAILDATGQQGSNLTIECSGAPRLQAATFSLAAQRGRILFLGLAHSLAMNVPLFNIQRRELQIRASTAASESAWQAAIRILAETGLDLTPIISDVFPFSECRAAIDAASDPAHHAKVLLRPGVAE